jgi:hypothetical protein
MTDQKLESLNKAYLLGEYDLKRYRELREAYIDVITGVVTGVSISATKTIDTNVKQLAKEITQEVDSDPTLQITAVKPATSATPKPGAAASSMRPEKSHRGPNFLQFLWVSVAILLFIYMYTATID